MKSCRNIRRELSAYFDGELTLPQRTEVETHLASCVRCQRELLEMKTLVTGMAALPTMQPPPRFLAEVRRKIARGEDPEAPTWYDYMFRPIWLKVPLEMAALIVIIGLMIEAERPLPTQTSTSVEFAKADNSENEREDNISARQVEKTTVTDTLKSTDAAQAPTVEASQEDRAAPAANAGPAPLREALEKDEKSVSVLETLGLAVTANKGQSVDQSAKSEITAGRGESQPAADLRRVPAFDNSGELSTLPPSPSVAAGAVRSMQLAQSKPGETVTIHGRDFDDVRSRVSDLRQGAAGGLLTSLNQKRRRDMASLSNCRKSMWRHSSWNS